MRKINKRILWTSIVVAILYIKSLLLTFMSASNDGYGIYGIPFDIRLILPHLAILSIIILPSLMLKGIP